MRVCMRGEVEVSISVSQVRGCNGVTIVHSRKSEWCIHLFVSLVR